MTTLEKKIDICLRWILSEGTNELELAYIKEEAYEALNDCVCYSKDDIHSIIVSLLKELGISQHLRGFDYMVYAIEMALEDRDCLKNTCKVLYPSVAEKVGSTGARVERSIRHAIENGIDKGNVDTWYAVFGNSIHPDKGKPTNREFITSCANYVKKYIEG